jgi:hypothetical protein
MILSNPPRIVLDVMKTEAPSVAEASAPAPHQPARPTALTATPKPAPTEEPTRAAAPEPRGVQQPRVETPVEPEPVPEPVVAPPSEIAPEPAAAVEPGEGVEPEVIAAAKGPAVEPPQPTPQPRAPVQPRTPRRLRGQPEPEQAAAPTLTNPMLLGGVGAVAIVLVLAVALRRRRKAKPDALDEDDLAESDAGRIPAGGFPMGDSAMGSDSDLFGASPAVVRPAAGPSSIFDDDDMDVALTSKGDGTMSQELSDLPSDRAAMPPPPAGRASSGGAGDFAHLVQDLERRMGQLEQQLAESNEAREKLERQVAAQTEELRVQRAAIARTQRALRSLTRGDEDKATEPALRDDTQARTRVNL